MRITVLGKSPSWADASGACSGYLVEHDGYRLLLDCGNGVFAKLRAQAGYTDVDAVLISHLHADHFLDLVPYSYGLRNGPDHARPRLLLPPGATARLRRVVGTWGSEDLVDGAFDTAEYDPAQVLRLGPVRVTLQEVPHYVLCHAVAVETARHGRFVFGADCGPNEAIVSFAAGAELLMLEATLGAADPEPDGADGSPPGHLTAAQAGDHARRAGAGRLVLSHFSDELDGAALHDAARDAYGADVELAAQGATYDL